MISYDIPDGNSIEVIADWIELCIALENTEISTTEVGAAIRNSTNDDPNGALLSDVWLELRRRAELYGNNPPFIVNDYDIVPIVTLQTNPSYVFCLLLSLNGNPRQPTVTGKLFERLCNEALRNYIDGDSVIFGYPGTTSVASLCGIMHEKFKSELPVAANDKGLDVVAWRPLDSRGNQLIVFMQCAGGHNWKSKTSDVVMRHWSEVYIGFHVKPTRAFSTAVLLSNEQEFYNTSLDADLIFDRARIYRYTQGRRFLGNLEAEIEAWCTTTLIDILN